MYILVYKFESALKTLEYQTKEELTERLKHMYRLNNFMQATGSHLIYTDVLIYQASLLDITTLLT
jgi:hypothetical protein